jgi:hypothetical protein
LLHWVDPSPGVYPHIFKTLEKKFLIRAVSKKQAVDDFGFPGGRIHPEIIEIALRGSTSKGTGPPAMPKVYGFSVGRLAGWDDPHPRQKGGRECQASCHGS